jgi:surfactin synthase thioesterase subunit
MSTALVTRYRPEAQLTLFCLPSAGMSASLYRGWHEALPGYVQVAAVQWPGRENRFGEPLLTSMDAFLDEALRSIGPHLDRPFALFGHSMGAIVAYELVNRLRVEGRPMPVHLTVSSHLAPHLCDGSRQTARLPAPKLVESLREAGGVGEEFLANPEYLDLMLPVVRADLTVIEAYRWTGHQVLDVPVTAICGRDDIWADPRRLDGWGRHTTGRFTTRVVDGGHFLVREQRETVVPIVADDILLSMSLRSHAA